MKWGIWDEYRRARLANDHEALPHDGELETGAWPSAGNAGLPGSPRIIVKYVNQALTDVPGHERVILPERSTSQMTKLLEKYRANPTLKNAKAVIAYGRKHPFSACLLSASDADLHIAAGKQARGEA